MSTNEELLIRYGQAVEFLPPRLRDKAMALQYEKKLLAEEFRLRAGYALSVNIAGKEEKLPGSSAVRHEELQTVLELATSGSVHSAQASIKEGYITVSGGHRVGLCGTSVISSNGVRTLRDISSICIRIAKSVETAAENVYPKCIKDGSFLNTLIISPPGFGKTTMLRDMVRRLSGSGFRVSLVDERGEIAAKRRAASQFDVGERTDILDGIDKASGAMLMLRAMSPDIIALDEITAECDIDAIEKISNCGVAIIATAHGYGVDSLLSRPMYKKLYDLGIFEVAVVLSREEGRFRQEIHKLSPSA